MPWDLSPRELAFAVILIACDAFGLVVGARLLARRSAPTGGFVRDGVIWLVFGIVWASIWGLGSVLALQSKFAMLRVITHVLLFVMAPLAVARGFASIRLGHRTQGALPLAVGLAMVAVYSWAYFVEPRHIEFTEHRLQGPRIAALSGPVRIAILADIQTDEVGDYEVEVFRRTAELRPDLVLLPGDFVQTQTRQDFAEQAVRFRELFAVFEPWPRLGVFAVTGDIDPVPELFDGTRVRVIDDQVVGFAGEPGLQLVGLGLPASRIRLGGRALAAVEGFGGYSIVMGHAPDYAMPLIDGEVRGEMLCIAGHTHGGQVVVPGLGPPITLTSVPRRFAAGGLFDCGDARLCISRGIGLERGFAPRVRLFCRPQVVVVDLVPEL